MYVHIKLHQERSTRLPIKWEKNPTLVTIITTFRVIQKKKKKQKQKQKANVHCWSPDSVFIQYFSFTFTWCFFLFPEFYIIISGIKISKAAERTNICSARTLAVIQIVLARVADDVEKLNRSNFPQKVKHHDQSIIFDTDCINIITCTRLTMTHGSEMV